MFFSKKVFNWLTVFFCFQISGCTIGNSFNSKPVVKKISEKLDLEVTESKTSVGRKTIKVLTFNVENLFDEKDDPGKKDETYLPKEDKRDQPHKDNCYKMRNKSWRHACLHWDWDKEFVDQKLSRIAEVVSSSFSGGPDLIFLQEVENKRVLDLLLNNHLKKLGYTTANLLEGTDPRGIDVGIIHKGDDIRPPSQRTFKISRKNGKRSNHVRPLLISSFEIKGKKIAAVSVHFPSPRHPTVQRVEGIHALSELGKKLSSKHDLVIAGGDFNVNSAEDSRIYRELAGENWRVSHHEDCKRCLGTNYYKRRKSWSFLDAILVFKGKRTNHFKQNSTRIIKDLWFQQTSAGRPARMHLRGNKLDGISDHFAIATEVVID